VEIEIMSVDELSEIERMALISSELHSFMESRSRFSDEVAGMRDLEDLAIDLFVRKNLGSAEFFITLFLNNFAVSTEPSELADVLRGVARRAELFFRAAELFERDVKTLLGNLYTLDNKRREEEKVRTRRFEPVRIERPAWAEQVGEGEVRTCTATAKAKSTIWQIDNLPEAKVSHRLRNRLLEQLEYDTDVSRLLASVIRWIDCQKNSNSFQDFYWMSVETKSNDMVFSVRTDQKLVEIEKVPTSWGQQFDGRIEFYACNQETDGRRLWQLMLRGEN
jgi:hypothetical protein